MNHYKLYVDMKEGTHDYVSATVYNMFDEKVLELCEIRKPENVADYTHEWKTGLYPYYEKLAISELNDYNATFSHL